MEVLATPPAAITTHRGGANGVTEGAFPQLNFLDAVIAGVGSKPGCCRRALAACYS